MNVTRIKHILVAAAAAGAVAVLTSINANLSLFGLEQPWPEVVTLILGYGIQEAKELEDSADEAAAGDNK